MLPEKKISINKILFSRKKKKKKTPLEGSTLGASSASPSPSNPPPPSVSDTAAVRPDPHQARPGRRLKWRGGFHWQVGSPVCWTWKKMEKNMEKHLFSFSETER